MTTPDTAEIRDLPAPSPHQPEGLPPIPGGWTEREWTIEGQLFRLTLPAEPDAFLEDPEVRAAFDRDAYMPYWAFLWPSALKMTATVLKSDWPQGAEVLELGSGIGIVGLAGLARGLRVTMSDYEPKAVQLAMYNAQRNGFVGGDGLVLDWRTPSNKQYPFIWGCDLLYEERNHDPLLKLTKQALLPEGVAWYADGGRTRAETFCEKISQAGLSFRLLDEDLQPLSVPRVGRYQLIEIRHQS